MANDFNKPTVSDNYATTLIPTIKDNQAVLAQALDPAVVTVTNPPTNAVRWNSANGYWEKYNGSSWAALAATYGISISGLAGTATRLATARAINGVNFDGSAAIGINLNNSVTFNSGGAGGASGSAFNGGGALTVSYNTVGAPSTGGAGASGTWGISITGSSASCTGTAANANTLGGNGYSATGGANTMVQRDGSGYIQNNYFYTSVGGSERNASGMSYFAGFNASDYYIRSYTPAAVAAAISGQAMNISGSSTSCTGNAATASSCSGNSATATTAGACSGNSATATVLATARNIDGQSFNGSADITVIAPGTHTATLKTTPSDADEFPLIDSVASFSLKKITWAALKSAIGIGYYTGSGGTVTQTTSKSTGVTLNTSCGKIETSTAALAAGASVSFLLTNSNIGLYDILAVNVSGLNGQATANAYRVMAQVYNGSAYITLTNISSGSLSQQVPIIFSVIKGAIS